MTKRILGICLVLTLPATFLVGCGGDDKADSTTTTAAKSSGTSADKGSGSETTTDSGSSSGSNMTVDEFCAKTKELAGLVRDAKNGMDTTKSKQATELSKELSAKAQNLATELVKDPSLAKRYAECARELATTATGN